VDLAAGSPVPHPKTPAIASVSIAMPA